MAEKTGLEIPQTLERYKCWEDIAKARVREKGALESFIIEGKFQNNEAKKYYLKGWVEDLPTLDCNADLILSTRHKLIQDIGSLYVLLQKHALHELFFNKASQDKIYHFNRVLNIQWAIDIKNSFNAN